MVTLAHNFMIMQCVIQFINRLLFLQLLLPVNNYWLSTVFVEITFRLDPIGVYSTIVVKTFVTSFQFLF